MSFNVATLLQEPVGSRRRARLEAEPMASPADRWAAEVSGSVDMLRTMRGVLVLATVQSSPVLECARCLDHFAQDLEFRIEEEFVPVVNLVTGERVEAAEDELRIDEHHLLDLSEAVRQYEQAAIPLQPICRPGCAGLCPECGANRNETRCDCDGRAASGPFAALAGLGAQLRAEETDGGTEA
ncbi:MAG: DUF177 domain-containing protein [Chloroflexota bacterium]|nr:DUF177 domain-containing protein [Chloroflexota bacterium]